MTALGVPCMELKNLRISSAFVLACKAGASRPLVESALGLRVSIETVERVNGDQKKPVIDKSDTSA